jgi:hypothetical protein
MRGRTPWGLEYIEQVPGTDKAKQRVRAIFETLMGRLRVHEACARLDVCEQRIRQMRREIILGAVERAEDRPPGRPAQPEESDEVVALRAEVARLQRELEAARISAEVAVALPHVAALPAAPAADPAAPQKKSRQRKK